MMKNLLSLLFALGTLSLPAWATIPENLKNAPRPVYPVDASTCAYGTARAVLDINNVRTLLYNGGDGWYDLSAGVARYEIPKLDDLGVTKTHAMFAASIWVSGNELGTNNIFVMALTYRGNGRNQSYWPGPLDNLTAFTNPARCQVWDKMFKINRLEVLDFESRYVSGLIKSTSDIPTSVLTWPGKGNPHLPSIRGFEGINMNYDLARFIDRDGNGIYDPLAGDSPRLPGREAESSGADQCIYWVMNDEGNQKRFGSQITDNRAIGMEISTEAFAYATSDYVNDMTFYRQKLTNKGTTILEDCYFGQWADPDLGNFNDDYVGFNVLRGLAICYNGDDFDEGTQGYGANPPSIAIDFFKGPMADPNDKIDNNRNGTIDEPGELIIASNFSYYTNGAPLPYGDPTPAREYYYYMRSKWQDNTNYSLDYLGAKRPESTQFPRTFIPFPGLSDNVIGWSAGGTIANPRPITREWTEKTAGNTPGDRRMLTNAGPFTLQPGAVNELTIGVVWARASSGGATGSFSKLLIADDAAQKLFDNDFKILDGPDAPDVEITELDKELLVTITPHARRTSTGQIVNTETYQERDFNSLLTDPFYRFEGYLVYQLADASVGFGDLDNRDKAILIGNLSSDIKNGVSKIINQEYDEVLTQFIPKIKVSGNDEGLIRTFSVKQDFFSGKNLVNYQKYFFTVLAYGYNGDSSQNIQFIQGRQNRDRYLGMPHKVASEQFGYTLGSRYNQNINVLRLQGIGNSGTNFDSLTKAAENAILLKNSLDTVAYANGVSSVTIKVYNPKKVVGADLKIRLYSRISYRGSASTFTVGDTIVSTWARFTPTGSLIRDPSLLQKPGIAVIKSIKNRVGGEADQVDLEVEMQNDGVGGRFTSVQNSQNTSVNPARFVNYVYGLETFIKKNDASKSAICNEYLPYDYWKLYESEIAVDSSSRPLSVLRDQIAVKYGLLISITNKFNPGEFLFINRLNGFLESSILSSNRTRPSFIPITYTGEYTDTSRANWWANAEAGLFGSGKTASPGVVDITGTLRTVIDGSFGNLFYTKPYQASDIKNLRPTYSGAAPVLNILSGEVASLLRNSMFKMQNVDIVLTNDQSKWTRCIVFQGDTILNRTTKSYNGVLLKSKLPSVDKQLAPTGELSNFGGRISRGMSWFPGYAIDLDRGIRLNMAFLESQAIDTVNGNNLKWEPGDDTLRRVYGFKNYIYVFANNYDSAKKNEALWDSIATIGAQTFRDRTFAREFWSNCTWVGRLAKNSRSTGLNAGVTRIRLRISKGYRSAPDSGGKGGVPTYVFTTKGLQSTTNVAAVGKTMLDSIRVVPNPYYAYASYEQSQVDNRVRITNLPTKYTLSIFTLSGSLIRQFRADFSNQDGINKTVFQDWDLKTQTGLPIASGAYIIYIDAGALGTKTVKWFGILRPTDLDAIGL